MKSLLVNVLLLSSTTAPGLAQSIHETTAHPRLRLSQSQLHTQHTDQVAQAESETTQPSLSLTQKTNGFYLTGAVGSNLPTNSSVNETTIIDNTNYSYDDHHYGGFSAEVGVGYDFGNIRAEITYAYDGSSLASYTDQVETYQYNGGAASKNSVFASSYWDINLKSRWTPYIGGGVGYSSLAVTPSGNSQTGPGAYPGYRTSSFAYQAKLGISYRLNRRTDTFIEGSYRGTSGYSFTDNGVKHSYNNYNSWGLQLGARLHF